MSGGSFSGTLVNNGSFSYSGGSFNGALTNASAGTLSLATVLRAGGAVSNQGRVDLGPSAGLVGSTLRNDGVIHVTGGGGLFTANIRLVARQQLGHHKRRANADENQHDQQFHQRKTIQPPSHFAWAVCRP